MTYKSTINVPIPTHVFIALNDFLRSQNNACDPVDAVNNAIEYWMENASWKQEDLVPKIFDHEKGYRWKQLFLPHGTLVRMKYKGNFSYAKIEGDEFIYNDNNSTPSAFANTVTGTRRNAWRDLEVKLPSAQNWQLADYLRSQELKTHIPTAKLNPTLPKQIRPNTNDMAWHEIINKALRNLGGKAHLSEIYIEIRKIVSTDGNKLPEAFEQTIRGALETNSSDSDKWKKNTRDLFYMAEGKGRGVWALRE